MEKIEGKIIVYLYHNKENGYSIAKLKTNIKTWTISGFFPVLSKEVIYAFNGDFFVHPKYGETFKVVNYETVLSNREGIINYLCSDLFIGIGEKTAQKIYDVLGANCLDEIIKNKDILDLVPLSQIKKESLYKSLLDNKFIETILVKLFSLGISGNIAYTIYEKYGEKTLDIIEQDPYLFSHEIDNMGFLKCDAIAKANHYDMKNEKRICCGIIYILEEYTFKMGYSFLFYEQIIKETKILLEVEEDLIIKCITDLISRKDIIVDDDKYYSFRFYKVEKGLAAKIKVLAEKRGTYYREEDIKEAIKTLNEGIIEYTPKQLRIIEKALNSPFSVITGGPGTGKTTIISGLIKCYRLLNNYTKTRKEITLVAPTGRAAKRMCETTDYPASTIHRALGYGHDEEFLYGPNNKLPSKILIVDESSMIDMFLAYQLFQALDDECVVVMIGDINQLPSVGPGQILKEIIESELVDVFELKEVFRQFADSPIIRTSNDILDEEIREYAYEVSRDNIVDEVINKISEFLQLGYSLNDIQVLSPMYKNEGGIDNLNNQIQNRFNQNKKVLNFRKNVFKVNDRVIQNVNDVQKQLMNGDVGIIIDIFKSESSTYLRVDFDGYIVNYPQNELDGLSLAYALSVHKSQGSEYKVVILVILKEHFIMLKKKLLYTAVTRAKEELIILGSNEAFLRGIMDTSYNRQTALFQKKVEEISPYDFLDE